MTIKSLPSIGIIGFGWVGQALFRHIEKLAVKDIVASVTSQERINELSTEFRLPLSVLDVTCDVIEKKSHPIFEQDSVIICIPPKFKHGKKDYDKVISSIVTMANIGSVKQLILLNSTAVYQGCSGVVDESTSLVLDDEKSKLMYRAEKSLEQFEGNTTVLRLAGLVGPKRHPGRFFSAISKMQNAQLSVNLVHQQDVVLALVEILEKQENHAVYNLVSPYHAAKFDFYSQACLDLKNEILDYQVSSERDRIINGDKIEKSTKFNYQIRDLTDWDIYR